MVTKEKENIRVYYVHNLGVDGLTAKHKIPQHIPKHNGIVAVASIRNDDGSFNLGFSFCSAKDEFCKQEAKYRAIGRAGKYPIVISPDKGTMKETILAIMKSPDSFQMSEVAHKRFPKFAHWYHRLLVNNNLVVQ